MRACQPDTMAAAQPAPRPPAEAPGADFLRRRLARPGGAAGGAHLGGAGLHRRRGAAAAGELIARLVRGALLALQRSAHGPVPHLQIPALLPLTADGAPLLSVESAECEQRALQAFLHWAAAGAASPQAAQSDVDATRPLVAHLSAVDSAAHRGWQPQPLTDVLCGHLVFVAPSEARTAMELRRSALAKLTEPDAAAEARRKLAEAAAAAAGEHPPAAPLPSLEQLLCACHYGIANNGCMLLEFTQQVAASAAEVARACLPALCSAPVCQSRVAGE